MSVSGEIHHIHFFSNDNDGFRAIFEVVRNGDEKGFTCSNCADGSSTRLHDLYLDGEIDDFTGIPGKDGKAVSRCDKSCDFYSDSGNFP